MTLFAGHHRDRGAFFFVEFLPVSGTKVVSACWVGAGYTVGGGYRDSYWAVCGTWVLFAAP